MYPVTMVLLLQTTEQAYNESGDDIEISVTINDCFGVANTRCANKISMKTKAGSVEIVMGNHEGFYVDATSTQLPYFGFDTECNEDTTKFIYCKTLGLYLFVQRDAPVIYINADPYFENKVIIT